MRTALLVGGWRCVAGCALKAPPPHTEVLDQALPKGTTIPPAWKAEPTAGAVADDWLKTFNDPPLDAIVAEAIANNLDLRQAAETRSTIAQQAVVVVGAQLLPQVGAVLGGRTTNDEDHASDVQRESPMPAWHGSSTCGEGCAPSAPLPSRR